MSRSLDGRRVPSTDFSVEIGDDQVGGFQAGVVHAAGLDDHQRLLTGAVDAAGVAKGVRSEAAAGNFLVGVEDFFAQRFEQHGGFPWCNVARFVRCSGQTVSVYHVKSISPAPRVFRNIFVAELKGKHKMA